MPSPGHRQLSTSLTILIVLVAHPACGFSLRRAGNAPTAPDATTDLALEESVQLQIKNGLRTPNDIKQTKHGDTKTSKDKFLYKSEDTVKDLIEDTTIDTARETVTIPETPVFATTHGVDIATQRNQTYELNSTLVSLPTAMDTTSLVTSTNESKEKTTTEYYTVTKKSRDKNATIEQHNEAENKSELTTLFELSSTEEAKINDQIAIDSEATENLSLRKISNNYTTSVATETTNTDKTHTKGTESSGIISSSTPTLFAVKENTEKTSNGSVAYITLATTTPSIKQKELTKNPVISTSTVVRDATILVATEPSWKKYTTIERRRVASSEETTSSPEKDLTNAESIRTTLSLLSTGTLSEELLSNANQPSTSGDSVQTENRNADTKSMPTSESIERTQSEILGTVASKRGGFLDLSKRTTTQIETNTASSEKQTETHRTLEEIEAIGVDTQDIKKVSGYESRSQLAEDAMKEELMKEEMISNRLENANRIEEVKRNEVKPAGANDAARSDDSSASQSSAEDALSVQPIHQERRTTLYPVGGNYKQMKRIEVQPAKPFVRDPDDNSWRNESISSLGIVFKPKNTTSKSFKEVLKTKSETEFNNLQDRDSKGDTPELRERLEKITEVRKSKKKMVDKFGEVVYTDYEEGGSAESASARAGAETGLASSTTPTTVSEGTSPMASTEGPRYWKKRLESINKVEMFKELGLDILTTQQPKKAYNIAEYYDTTDEYDADYVTRPEIDIKKYTQPPAPRTSPRITYSPLTAPPMPYTTRLAAPRFPDRRPTVQYFPPTTKPQKVNVNDYDVDFEKRVRLYTLPETTRTAAPREPVATDRPDVRPTVKPTSIATYRPVASREPPATRATFLLDDGSFDRGTYVIKHYGDFLQEAARDEERVPDMAPHTPAPAPHPSTIDQSTQPEFEYEDEARFQKAVLGRFVDTFNRHSDRFKVDFPVLFNSSVVHRAQDARGAGASSSAFLKRQYEEGPAPAGGEEGVELSPAYELHYYVPDQEEREQAAPGPGGLGPVHPPRPAYSLGSVQI